MKIWNESRNFNHRVVQKPKRERKKWDTNNDDDVE